MVPATELAATGSSLLGESAGLLTLRVRGSEHDGRVVHIRSPKCTIGSDPSCTLRLRGAGIGPFHCLILRGAEGTFIRRLSPETCLNGRGFEVSRLRPDDRLAIGPIELEVLPSMPCPGPEQPIASPLPPARDAQDQRMETELLERCQRLEDELRGSRQEQQRLLSAATEAEAGANRLQLLEKELDAIRRNLADERAAAHDALGALEAELRMRDQQLTGALWELVDHQKTGEEQVAQGQAIERQLRDELQATRDRGETADREIESLRVQLSETNVRLSATQQHLTESPPASSPSTTGETNWQELAERLNRELQQARDEHRRVREEWHVDRQGLERQLAECSHVSQQLEQKYKQDMREAETLIHSMQQEGKHLLTQLEEARQTIHQDIDRRKKRQSLVSTVRSMIRDSTRLPVHVADAVQKTPVAEQPAESPAPTPPAMPQSACPTMLMGSPAFAAEPAATPQATADSVPDEPLVPTLALRAEELPKPSEPATPQGIVAETPQTPTPTSTGDAEEDHDGVIERYMERLMQRVARVPEDVDTTVNKGAAPSRPNPLPQPHRAVAVEPEKNVAQPTPVRTSETPAPPVVPTPIGTDGSESPHITPALPTPPAAPTPPVADPPQILPKPRESAPELVADLLAMRKLAVRTARSDIDRSVIRQCMITAVSEITVATVCLVSGVLVSILSHELFAAHMIGGALGLSFGVIFLMRGLMSCTRLRRMKAQAEQDAMG